MSTITYLEDLLISEEIFFDNHDSFLLTISHFVPLRVSEAVFGVDMTHIMAPLFNVVTFTHGFEVEAWCAEILTKSSEIGIVTSPICPPYLLCGLTFWVSRL